MTESPKAELLPVPGTQRRRHEEGKRQEHQHHLSIFQAGSEEEEGEGEEEKEDRGYGWGEGGPEVKEERKNGTQDRKIIRKRNRARHHACYVRPRDSCNHCTETRKPM